MELRDPCQLFEDRLFRLRNFKLWLHLYWWSVDRVVRIPGKRGTSTIITIKGTDKVTANVVLQPLICSARTGSPEIFGKLTSKKIVGISVVARILLISSIPGILYGADRILVSARLLNKLFTIAARIIPVKATIDLHKHKTRLNNGVRTRTVQGWTIKLHRMDTHLGKNRL